MIYAKHCFDRLTVTTVVSLLYVLYSYTFIVTGK